jgi:hypothetical protein
MRQLRLINSLILAAFASASLVSAQPATSKTPLATKPTAKGTERFELAPENLSFALTGTKIVIKANGEVSLASSAELQCNGKPIAVTSTQITNAFISTRDFGRIKLKVKAANSSQGIEVFITRTQKALLLKRGFAQDSPGVPVAAGGHAFVEKSRFELTQQKDRTLDFKNIGGSPSGIMMNMVLSDGDSTMAFAGFHAGTLVVVGDTGLILDDVLDRAGYTIKCTHNIQGGTTIEVRAEEPIIANLGFVRDGTVVTTFSVKDADGKDVMANKRTIRVKNGRIQRVLFGDSSIPTHLVTSEGRIVDVQAMAFDVKPSRDTQRP